MLSSDVGAHRQVEYAEGEEFAQSMDASDELRHLRAQFLFPQAPGGGDCLYLAGNSLGLQPVNARSYVDEELDDWARLAVEGHFSARHPWLPYHENLTEMTARIVGAKPFEVVVMNTLTVNLHLMMVSFYRPTRSRYKILVEHSPFPSDKYAVDSQAAFHGFAAQDAVIEQMPRPGEAILRTEDILATIAQHGESIALVLFGQVNYLSGQAFDIPAIVKVAHDKGCSVGFNLAHGAGNLLLHLHDWDVDFAVWCGYKYLNAGPGALAGCFVHERHGNKVDLPRFAGWWGHDKDSRFQMGAHFQAIPGAEGWQLSNPPILQLAALRASLELFDQATMPALQDKSETLTGYLEYLLAAIPNQMINVLTPGDRAARGCQLSCRLSGNPRKLVEHLRSMGTICDFREPDVIRMAPVPLYNSYTDVYKFAKVVADCLTGKAS